MYGLKLAAARQAVPFREASFSAAFEAPEVRFALYVLKSGTPATRDDSVESAQVPEAQLLN
jgi:hypothetical protein